MAFQGSIINWVADHRRHHAFTDKEGDPHSPWRYGTTPPAVAKGSCMPTWAGCSPGPDQCRRFAPDLLADRDIGRVDRLFPLVARQLDRPGHCSAG